MTDELVISGKFKSSCWSSNPFAEISGPKITFEIQIDFFNLRVLIQNSFPVTIVRSSPVVLIRTLYAWEQRSKPGDSAWFLWKRFLFSKIHCTSRQQYNGFETLPEIEPRTHRLSGDAPCHYTTIHEAIFQIEFISTKKLLFENLIIALQKSPLGSKGVGSG